jgi:hypothetical protein
MIHINDNYLKAESVLSFFRHCQTGRRPPAASAGSSRDQAGHRRCYPRPAHGLCHAFHKAVDEMAADASFADTVRSRAMNSCAKPLPKMIFKPAGQTSVPMKYSSATAPSATRGISRRFSTPIPALPFPTRSTLSTWTPMSWPAARDLIAMGATMGLSTWTATRKMDSSPSCPRRQGPDIPVLSQ